MTLPRPKSDYDAETFRRGFDEIEQRLRSLEAPAHTGYVVTNQPASLRTIDGASGTLPQVLQLLATLIKDLKAKGTLGK